ncbi:MAG: serine O-acetyltransferase [FCB group bacterium]|jgi:serine O-acetyltransferase|nr:serine O-acetyltransferase [FCB group bacterium]
MHDTKEIPAVRPQDAADPLWETIRAEVAAEAEKEPMLASFLYSVVLNHRSLEDALSFLLASKLESGTIPSLSLRDLMDEAFNNDPAIRAAVRADIRAVCERDPACRGFSIPLLYFKGFHALQSYRVANYYWQQGRESLALFLQSRISKIFSVDIHPAARIGSGIHIDHATGVVIGETAVVEDNVSMFHEVTLGGTGKQTGDRHPKIRKFVMLGAGAKILGNVEVGEGSKVAAGSMVLKDVPPHCTVAGVPAEIVRDHTEQQPALEMDQSLPNGK